LKYKTELNCLNTIVTGITKLIDHA